MKTPTKFLTALLGVLLIGTSSFAVPQTILIDFNDAAGSAGTGWNAIAGPTATFASGIALTNTDGNASGLSIGTFLASEMGDVNTNMGDSSTNINLAPFTGDASWVTAAAGNDYFFGGSNDNSVGFTIRGLTAGQEYTVDLFASHNATRIGDYIFRSVDDANPTVSSNVLATFSGFDSGNNTSNVMSLTFTAVSGEALQISGFANSAVANSGTRFNAMQIVAIPEPSTIILLGIALGSVLLIRRRNI